MNNSEIAEILKFCSPNVIYVVTWNNIFKKVFCPFKVKVKKNIGVLKKGEIYFVESVKVDLNIKTVYIIDSKPYYFENFDIILD